MAAADGKVRRVDFSPDEFLAGVAGEMSMDDFAVYWMVCTLIYSRGEAIKDDAAWIAAKFRKTNPRSVRAAIERLVVAKKVVRTDGELMVNRCRIELETTVKRIRTASENGSKGGRKRVERSADASENNELENQTLVDPPNQHVELTTTINTNHQSEEEKEAPSGAYKNVDPEIVCVVVTVEPEPKEKSRAKRRTAIPEDWQPDARDVDFARSKGNDERQIIALAEGFVNHHIAEGNLFADIPAAWRKWVGNDIKFHGNPANRSGSRPGRPTGGYRQGGRSDVEIIADLVAEAERTEQGGGVRLGDDDDGFFGGLRVVS